MSQNANEGRAEQLRLYQILVARKVGEDTTEPPVSARVEEVAEVLALNDSEDKPDLGKARDIAQRLYDWRKEGIITFESGGEKEIAPRSLYLGSFTPREQDTTRIVPIPRLPLGRSPRAQHLQQRSAHARTITANVWLIHRDALAKIKGRLKHVKLWNDWAEAWCNPYMQAVPMSPAEQADASALAPVTQHPEAHQAVHSALSPEVEQASTTSDDRFASILTRPVSEIGALIAQHLKDLSLGKFKALCCEPMSPQEIKRKAKEEGFNERNVEDVFNQLETRYSWIRLARHARARYYWPVMRELFKEKFGMPRRSHLRQVSR